MPYSVTIKPQTESLTPGAFLKEWCSHKRIFHKKETRLAQEIVTSMEKREEGLLRNKLFLGGVFVDSRYRILLTSEQMENAKFGLHEVTLKNYHCSTSVSNSASSAWNLRNRQAVLQATINRQHRKRMKLRKSLT